MSRATLLTGDALTVLRTLPERAARCCVTSPPYWGLRDYGVEGQLGLEATPAEYVANMVQVFEEVRRVLCDDGTLWLNIGDCYATGAGAVGQHPGGGEQGARWMGDVNRLRDDKGGYRGERLVNTNSATIARPKTARTARRSGHEGKHDYANPVGPITQPNRMPIPGLKPKDMVMMPARLALALQAAGWWVRMDVIWNKPNPMPESVTDRPTKSHEYIYLLSKSERYFYDADAIAEPCQPDTSARYERGRSEDHKWADGGPGNQTIARSFEHMKKRRSGNKQRDIPTDEDGRGIPNDHLGCGIPWEDRTGKRNARSVWTIGTQPYPGAHFATFPTEIARRCILSGSAAGDTVIDPFGGSGTVAQVATGNGRDSIYIDLNPAYLLLARDRVGPLLCDVAVA